MLNKITSATLQKKMVNTQPNLETKRKPRDRVEAGSSNWMAHGDATADRGRPQGRVLSPDQEICM